MAKNFSSFSKALLKAKTEEEALSHYRRVRDEIKDFVLKLAV